MTSLVIYAPTAASKKLKVKPGLAKFTLMRKFLETFTDATAPVRVQLGEGADAGWAARVQQLLGPGKTDHGFWSWMTESAVWPAERKSILPELEALIAEAPGVNVRCDFAFCWVEPKTKAVLPGQRKSEIGKHHHELFFPVYGEWLRSQLDFTTIDPAIGCVGKFVLPFPAEDDKKLLAHLRAIEDLLGPYFAPAGFVVFDTETGKKRKTKIQIE